MKVYVDGELPIGAKEFGCVNCPYAEIQEIKHYFINNEFVSYRDCVCKLDKTCGFKDGQKTCPLQSLADHDKQVRKEVCEEFREIVRQKYPICYINMREKLFNSDEMTISFKKVSEILDQIKEKK